jgi:ATP-binding cassette, subfamily B, bacterial
MAVDVDLASIAWPHARLGELVENLAYQARLISRPLKLPQPPSSVLASPAEAIGRWIDIAAGHLGLEAEAVDMLYADSPRLIRAGGPAILRLPGSQDPNQPRLIALIKSKRNKAVILRPDLKIRRVSLETLRSVLCQPYEAPLIPQIDHLLNEAEVPAGRMNRARLAILNEQLGSLRIESGWLLRLPPGSGISKQFSHGNVYRPAWVLLLMYILQQILALASWLVIGRGIFTGNYDLPWLFAWAVLLFSTIPLQMIVGDAQNELSMNAGAIFKQRLMFGALKLDPEEIRHQGMGQFLGRVMESEAVEMLALGGGFTAILAFVELILAGFILSRGAGGMLQVALLGLWVLVSIFFLWRYYQVSREWAECYREMTNDLVEGMVGHRSRLVQEDPLQWHAGEDQALDRYFKLSEMVDRVASQLNALVTRGWIFVGLLGIAYPFIMGSATPASLAVSMGGVLFAAQGLGKMVSGSQSLVSLFIAWQQVGPLFSAASRPRQIQPLDFVSVKASPSPDTAYSSDLQPGPPPEQPLIQARDLVFRYRPFGRPVIQECSLQINQGDRVLLEGPSGGGKSTLGAILTGLRTPESGSLLLWGYDRQILGAEEWRRHTVMAPQFQENHVFSETFAFNLLMGRRWPAQPEDLQEAEAVCRELGLGELLERMPSGFQQMLGESGWQLSHGERSRLFIARTLLQRADLIILDESFGALDPENLSRALRCVLQRAPALLVIAHP